MTNKLRKLRLILLLAVVFACATAHGQWLGGKATNNFVSDTNFFLMNNFNDTNAPQRNVRASTLRTWLEGYFATFSMIEGSNYMSRFTNSAMLYVDVNGSDSTAVRGRIDLPWRNFSNAVAAAQSGDTVHIRNGRYTNALHYFPVSSYAVLISGKTNLTIEGAGPGAVLYGAGPGHHIGIGTNCHNIVLRNFQIEGSKAATSAGAWLTNGMFGAVRVFGPNVRDVVVDGVRFKNLPDHGVASIASMETRDVTVRNCYFENGGATSGVPALTKDGAAIVLEGSGWQAVNNVITNWARGIEVYTPGTDLHGIVARGNQIYGVPWHGIIAFTEGGGVIYDMIIADNIIEGDYALQDATVSGIALSNVERSTINRNRISRMMNGGIVAETTLLKGNQITANLIHGAVSGGISIWNNGVNATNVANNIISENVIDSIGSTGLQISGVNNLVINNQFTRFATNNAAAVGIRSFAGGTNIWNRIEGNVFRFSGLGTVAIQIEAGVLTNQVFNNTHPDLTVSDAGTGTIVGIATRDGFYTGTLTGETFRATSATVGGAAVETKAGVAGSNFVRTVTSANSILTSLLQSSNQPVVKTISAGSGIAIADNTTNLVVSATGGGAGEANTSSNVGSGVGIANAKVAVDLPFKSFVSANDLGSYSTNETNITFTATKSPTFTQATVTNALYRGWTNLAGASPVDVVAAGPGVAWLMLTNNTIIRGVAPTAGTLPFEMLLDLWDTNATTPYSVTFSNFAGVAGNQQALVAGTNNFFRVVWNKTNLFVGSWQGSAPSYSELAGSNYVNRTELNGSNYTTRAQINGSNYVNRTELNGSNYVNRTELNGSNYVNRTELNGSNYVNRTELNGSNYTSRAELAGSNYVVNTRTITVAGTANEITSSAGAQDFSANRTWTLSLHADITRDTEIAEAKKGQFGITIDGGGSAITTGLKTPIRIPWSGTITGWDIVADQSGSIVVDILKDTYANFPPVDADSIAGTELPTLSSAIKNQDVALSSWTTTVTAGDWVYFKVNSAATVTKVHVAIYGTKN